MPYASNADLPVAISSHLPDHAQDIFRKAFNNAWRTYRRKRALSPRGDCAPGRLGCCQEAIPEGRRRLGT